MQENKISGKFSGAAIIGVLPGLGAPEINACMMSMEKCLPGGKYGRIEYVPGGKNSGDKCGAALKI